MFYITFSWLRISQSFLICQPYWENSLPFLLSFSASTQHTIPKIKCMCIYYVRHSRTAMHFSAESCSHYHTPKFMQLSGEGEAPSDLDLHLQKGRLEFTRACRENWSSFPCRCQVLAVSLHATWKCRVAGTLNGPKSYELSFPNPLAHILSQTIRSESRFDWNPMCATERQRGSWVPNAERQGRGGQLARTQEEARDRRRTV